MKLYVAAGTFIILTGIKFAFPVLGMAVREKVMPKVTESIDYKLAFARLGERLSDPEKYISALYSRVTGEDWDEEENGAGSTRDTDIHVYEPVHLSQLISGTAYQLPDNELDNTELSESPDMEAKENEFEETEDSADGNMTAAVAAFMSEMEAYSDYAIPASVSVSYEHVPFEYSSPIPGKNSSGFGYRVHPILNTVKFHYGTDIAANSGDDIYAFADGTVRVAEESDSYGLYIIIDHADGYSTLYAHCSRLYVAEGQQVSLGDKIALVGSTGQATGPHLHFELRSGEQYLNPDYYINQV